MNITKRRNFHLDINSDFVSPPRKKKQQRMIINSNPIHFLQSTSTCTSPSLQNSSTRLSIAPTSKGIFDHGEGHSPIMKRSMETIRSSAVLERRPLPPWKESGTKEQNDIGRDLKPTNNTGTKESNHFLESQFTKRTYELVSKKDNKNGWSKIIN